MQARYKEKTPLKSKILLGPKYALLKEEFRNLRKQIKPRTGKVQKVLVFLSGADRDNITSQVIEALTLIKNSWRVNVVIGALHPYADHIKRLCLINNYICHVQTSNIPGLMAEADLAIGAGGSASLERCCLGLPALILALAENQIEIAESLDSTGACIYLGCKETLNSLIIKQSIVELLNSPDRIQMISNRVLSIVDGLGVKRVSKELVF